MPVPERRCVGCRRRAPTPELVRFAAVDGRLVVDPERTRPGRGAWLCRTRGCFEQAVARRAFARALRTPVDVPSELLDFTD